MKTLITTAAFVALLSAPAMAFQLPSIPAANVNTNTNANTNINTQGQTQGQAQGQVQGQGQAQSANNRNNVRNSNSYVNKGSASAAVGAATCTNGFSFGIPGAALGMSMSDKDCKKMMAAQMLLDAGAIGVQDFRTILFTTSMLRGFTTATPTASIPATKAHYAKCEKEASGRLRVTMAHGGDKATAVAQCKAAMR